MAEGLHVLGDDIGMLRVMHHDVNERLVSPHVFGNVGAVAVALQSV